MNALRQNPFLSGLILLTVVLCGVLGYLASGALTSYRAAMDSYTQAVQKLQQLQNRVPFPNEENVRKAEGLRDEYQKKLVALKDSLALHQTPLVASVAPQEFQDALRATVNEIVAKAEAAHVKLPENFYLGFDEYRDRTPSDKAAPQLSRQLGIISGIVGELIGANPESPMVKSIDSLARPQLPEERGEAPSATGLRKMPVSVGFTAEQGKLRILLNSLLKTPQFLIIRAMSLKNSNLQGPPVGHGAEGGANPGAGSPTQTAGAAANPGAQPAATGRPGSLNVILGREFVSTDLSLEIVDFQLGAPAAPATKK